ncbi:MAG: sulfatase-like hydrolase/transferase [Pirellulales bacterium]
MNRFILRNITATSLLLALTLLSMERTVEAKRPNVVVLLADDLGWKDISCYGGPVNTPSLDGMAAQGVRFTDFHSGAAVCSPSRATTLTGRHHIRAGVYSWISDTEQHSHLLPREVTLAEVLKENGYSTAHLGKWHLGMPHSKRKKPTPADHGFDYWFATPNGPGPSHKNPVAFVRNGTRVGEIKGYSCQVVVDEAITWLDKHRDPNQPFFLNIWFHEPHASIAAPDNIVSKYGELKDPAAIYSGTIDNTDLAVKRLLQKLAEVDAPENTLIVYSSDNGSYRADRVGHLRGIKGSNYEGGIRVPGIFCWPGTIRNGIVEAEPAGLVDLLPTVCGLLGIDKPKGVHLDGSDLSPLLTAGKSKFVRHQPLYWMLPGSGPTVAVRDGKFCLVAQRDYEFPRDKEALAAFRNLMKDTLIKNGTYEAEIRGSTFDKQIYEGFKDKEAEKIRGQFIRLNMFQESWIPSIIAGGYERFELYDLEKDPSQKSNIIMQHPEVFQKMKQQLLEINASIMADAPDWTQYPDPGFLKKKNKSTMNKEPKRIEEKTKIHRLESSRRSPFDAFVYLNRIPEKPEEGESAEGLAGRIFGRLANQEGRVLLKLPPGMNRKTYLGFKTFLETEGTSHVGHCVSCHTLPDLASDQNGALRNLKKSQFELVKLVNSKLKTSHIPQSSDSKDRDTTYTKINIDDQDILKLAAFISSLNDVSDSQFRNLILKATVLDTTNDIE